MSTNECASIVAPLHRLIAARLTKLNNMNVLAHLKCCTRIWMDKSWCECINTRVELLNTTVQVFPKHTFNTVTPWLGADQSECHDMPCLFRMHSFWCYELWTEMVAPSISGWETWLYCMVQITQSIFTTQGQHNTPNRMPTALLHTKKNRSRACSLGVSYNHD